MARCRCRGAAVTYHGDYGRRRLLAGHSITVSGRREAGEQREEGERSRKTDEEDEKHNRVRAAARAALNGCGRTQEQNHQPGRDGSRKNVPPQGGAGRRPERFQLPLSTQHAER